ncbi:hypothetical protein ABFS82_08G031800 [Erythranthe guttata]|uniref:TCP domain-containing protein n=1 Tax=Erythranthe guttata TaxID=4155 RepID=A0A022RZ06_ERYGU|nr:PREDICTED: transcription factor TCP13-like [Erythranthe guttata]EYU44205.1 hypothetical protein MIMGU_mgv1a011591mg [Erythranthe guttata]|eukprot:XP_012851715.1 PREDICTED: transcription factor TCP13-like [Erythranthe guttata]
MSSTSNNTDNNPAAKNLFKAATTSTTTTAASSWSNTRLKDPRIVRVSRAFGGKDRHSKVCTVRGLRDRRVRLSVPTAIQLYDLQDRLGLNQPSKVVDWLLDIAKNEIDELPPLQIPQGMMINWNSSNVVPEHSRRSEDINLFGGNNNKLKEVDTSNNRDEAETNWTRSSDEGALYNNVSAYNSYVRWDNYPSNMLTLSHDQQHNNHNPTKGHALITSAHNQLNDDWHNFSLQLPSYFATTGAEFDAEKANYDQRSQLESSSVLCTANLLPSQNNDGS